jgi:hypothetical protein
MDWAAHSTHVWRKHLGQWRRQCPQHWWPLRSVTGARPAYCWTSAARWSRARGSPKAASSRGASTAPAPGKGLNNA